MLLVAGQKAAAALKSPNKWFAHNSLEIMLVRQGARGRCVGRGGSNLRPHPPFRCRRPSPWCVRSHRESAAAPRASRQQLSCILDRSPAPTVEIFPGAYARAAAAASDNLRDLTATPCPDAHSPARRRSHRSPPAAAVSPPSQKHPERTPPFPQG